MGERESFPAERDPTSHAETTPVADPVLRRAFGSVADVARLHRGAAADEVTSRHRSHAVAHGRDVYLGAAASHASPLQQRVIVAHELAHVAQQSQGGGVPSAAHERAANRTVVHALTGRALPPVVGAGLSYQGCGEIIRSSEVDDLESLDGDDISEVVGRVPEVPAPGAPPPVALLGDPTEAAGALEEIASFGPENWRQVLLGAESPDPEVRAHSQALIARWVAENPSVREEALALATSGRGLSSDLALSALLRAAPMSDIDLSDHARIVSARLDLVRQVQGRVSAELARFYPHTGLDDTPISAIAERLADADGLELVELGTRASRLLNRYGLLEEEFARIADVLDEAGSDGPIADVVHEHATHLATATFSVTSDRENPSFDEAIRAATALPSAIASTLTQQLIDALTTADVALDAALAESGLVRRHYAHLRTDVLEPLDVELAEVLESLRTAQTLASTNPEVALRWLEDNRGALESVSDRSASALQSVQAARLQFHMDTQFVTPIRGSSDMPGPSGGGGLEVDLCATAAEQERKDSIAGDFEQLSRNFAQIARERDRDPEGSREQYDQQMELLEEVARDAEIWQMFNDIRLQQDLEMALLQLEVALTLVSLYVGGIAGGVTRWGLTRLGIGGLTRFVGTTAATATGFHFTQEVWESLLVEDAEYFDEDFGRDWALTFGLFLAMGGAGHAWGRFVDARAIAPVGAHLGGLAVQGVVFQSYESFFAEFVRSGHIQDFSDPTFPGQVVRNLGMLAILHGGMMITKPLTIPVTNRVWRLRIEGHNQRCEAYRSDLAARVGEGESRPALGRRARTLAMERAEIIRGIARDHPALIPEADRAHLETVIDAQVATIDQATVAVRLRMQPHETVRDAYYYEGDVDGAKRLLESRGFTVETETETGSLSVRGADGRMLHLLRVPQRMGGSEPELGTPESDALAAERYELIRTLTDDVPRIAEHTGFPPDVLRAVRIHLFVEGGRIPTGPDTATVRRFDPMPEIGRLWSRAYDGPLEAVDQVQFGRLLTHEFVELELMRLGLPYRSAHPSAWQGDTNFPTRDHFGAHDISPRERGALFSHYPGLGMPEVELEVGPRLENLTEVRSRIIEGLANRTDAPYTAVRDGRNQIIRFDALDPAELGTATGALSEPPLPLSPHALPTNRPSKVLVLGSTEPAFETARTFQTGGNEVEVAGPLTPEAETFASEGGRFTEGGLESRRTEGLLDAIVESPTETPGDPAALLSRRMPLLEAEGWWTYQTRDRQTALAIRDAARPNYDVVLEEVVLTDPATNEPAGLAFTLRVQNPSIPQMPVPVPTAAERAEVERMTDALRRLVENGDPTARDTIEEVLDLALRNYGRNTELGRLSDHIETLYESYSIIDSGGLVHPLAGESGYVEGIGRSVDCEAATTRLSGRQYHEIEAELGPPKVEGAWPGRVRLTWRFADDSSVHVDIPGRDNASDYMINREPHAGKIGPDEVLHLTEDGVGVPMNSTAAHLPIEVDFALRAYMTESR